MVMNPGMLWFSVPSPKVGHEPILGRTNVSPPVFSSSKVPPWREFETYIELAMHRSSTHWFIWRNQSLTQMPPSTCCLNSKRDLRRLNVSLEQRRLALAALEQWLDRIYLLRGSPCIR